MQKSTDSLRQQAAEYLKNIPLKLRRGVILEIKRRQAIKRAASSPDKPAQDKPAPDNPAPDNPAPPKETLEQFLMRQPPGSRITRVGFKDDK